ncbi:MAG: FtsW/RodA/SpoVE family cell cycle protein [Patescibacteria group bacterium]
MKLIKRPVYHKSLIIITVLLCILGMISLFSASLSLLDSQMTFYRTLLIQLVSLSIGFLMIYLAIYIKSIDYRLLYKKSYALYFFIATLFLQLLVFSPLGVTKNGANRWLDIGITVIQPSELFKIAIIIMLAFLIVRFRKEIDNIWYTLGIIGLLASIFFVLMISIRDMGTLFITSIACLAMLLVSRIRFRYTLGIFLLAGLALGGYILFTPQGEYARERIHAYSNENYDPQGNGYQIIQSVMTIGAGEIIGRGFGESLQKHKHLPEPLTDSIFAVYSEEWGFAGTMALLSLYFLLFYSGLKIALDTREEFGRYIAVGLTVLLLAQALYNIMAMLGMLPLSGMPLVFISKGGSSIVTSLLVIAILVNISRITLSNRRSQRI